MHQSPKQCRQVENEPLANCVKRFKGNQDSMAQNMGKEFLKDFVKNTSSMQMKQIQINEMRCRKDRMGDGSIYADEEQ
jgi:hypothetical protein